MGGMGCLLLLIPCVLANTGETNERRSETECVCKCFCVCVLLLLLLRCIQTPACPLKNVLSAEDSSHTMVPEAAIPWQTTPGTPFLNVKQLTSHRRNPLLQATDRIHWRKMEGGKAVSLTFYIFTFQSRHRDTVHRNLLVGPELYGYEALGTECSMIWS